MEDDDSDIEVIEWKRPRLAHVSERESRPNTYNPSHSPHSPSTSPSSRPQSQQQSTSNNKNGGLTTPTKVPINRCTSASPSRKLSKSMLRSPNKFQAIDTEAKLSPSPKRKSSPQQKLIKNSPLRFMNKKSSPRGRGRGIVVSPYKNKATQKLQFGSDPTPDTAEFSARPVTLDQINGGNFSLILSEVTRCYKDSEIFNKEELKVVDDYLNMSSQNRELYVRMYGRKIGWHRVSNIHYDNISRDLPCIFNQLEKNGFVTSDYDLEKLETVLNLFKVPELKTLCKSLSLDIAKKGKPELLQSLLNFGKRQKTICFSRDSSNAMSVVKKHAKESLGQCIKLSDGPLQIFGRILLLFSLANASPTEEREGFSQQLLLIHFVQIGKMVFPSYSMIKSGPIFKSREYFLLFASAKEVATSLNEAVEKKELNTVLEITRQSLKSFTNIINDGTAQDHDQSLPSFLRKYTAGSTYAYILMIGAESLKKDKSFLTESASILRHLLSQKLYLTKYRGRWYEQLALLLHHHMNQNTEAAQVLIQGLSDESVTEVWRRSLSDRGAMLNKRKKGKPGDEIKLKLEEMILKEEPLSEPISINIVSKAVQNNKPGFKKVYIQEDFENEETTYSSVEEYALSHYRTIGFNDGIHCEGSIITSMFGLFFWDIIYEIPIPDVFQSAYQSIPLDLTCADFYSSRKDAVDARLKEMATWSEEKVNTVVKQTFDNHSGKISLVSWDRFPSCEQVIEIVHCIGISVMGRICERLVKHFRIARSGFPDLTVWNSNQKKCKFVEVKGKGDTLSAKQRVWLDYLQKVGADAEVCLVNPK